KLFGLSNGMNCMMIDENGNVNFEGQSLFYDEILNDVFFNYTQEGNFLALGNTGQASTDSIAFGKCYLHGYNKYYTYYYDDNCLYFTDGSQFVIPAAPAPALLGDANNNRVVNISDVTCLINHLLSGEMMNSESFSSEAADVNRDGNLNISDVTALINLLLAQ
ncbi:MAG: dockerin type I repeat-containing protein, partial [Muribaculaceae bacterium]|nr:dockerin type I repeat-containing protein [Muribaculaceae bacterium]